MIRKPRNVTHAKHRMVNPAGSPVAIEDGDARSDPRRALLENLAEHQALLKTLVEIAREKMDAVRAADSQTLHRCTAREASVLERVLEFERRRKAVVARLAQTLRLPSPDSLTLSEIANELPEPFSSSVRARMLALRAVAIELQHLNRVATVVARDLHQHIRDVFTVLANANRESVVYGPQGREHMTTSKNILDAVG